LPDYYQGQ